MTKKENETIDKKIMLLEQDLLCEEKYLSENAPDTAYLLHSHDGCEIYLLLEGECYYYTENDGRRLLRGDVVCIPPYGFHRGASQNPEVYHRIVINIRDDLLRSLSTEKTDLSACFYQSARQLPVIHLKEEEITEFLGYSDLLKEALTEHGFGEDILINIYLRQILLFLNKRCLSLKEQEPPGILPDIVAETFSYVEEHLAEDLSLDLIGEKLHHNGTYLSRCFKQVMGVSLTQYIIAKRIARAQELLRKEQPPSEVCYLVGFNNYSNFSRSFSKAVGISPRDYQKSRRGT